MVTLFLACGVAVFLSPKAHFGSGFDDRRFDPPRYTILHAPGHGRGGVAAERGFRSTRALEPGWTLRGPTPDLEREDEQWL